MSTLDTPTLRLKQLNSIDPYKRDKERRDLIKGTANAAFEGAIIPEKTTEHNFRIFLQDLKYNLIVRDAVSFHSGETSQITKRETGTVYKNYLLGRLNEISEERVGATILIDDRILHGNPVVKGTRIPVYIVLDNLADGHSLDEIAEDYNLTLEQVTACIDFASSVCRVTP